MFEDDEYEPDGSECEVCHDRSQAVEYVADPYDYNLFDVENMRYLCPGCYHDRAADS